MIYLDYAATSGRKPETVYEAVNNALRSASGNPGRSGHQMSIAAGNIVREARVLCSRFFHAEAENTIIFCSNGTDALNLAIRGLTAKGGHIITSSMEHNSVARPLEYLKDKGVQVTKVATSVETGVNPEDIKESIRENTQLVVISHVSNVTGTLNDIASIGRICREKNVPFLVDAAQSAGSREIDVQNMNIDLLAFPGHKCLFGPQGTGGLYIRPGMEIAPLKQGGTGSRSESLHQPEELPDRYESGTLNVPGIAGLAAGIRFLMQEGMEKIRAKEESLTYRLIDGISEIDGVTIYGPKGKNRGAVVSINIEGVEPQDASVMLDQIFDIGVRSGMHCAPDAHETLGTLETGGTIRISPGYFTETEEIDSCIEAIRAIAEGEV